MAKTPQDKGARKTSSAAALAKGSRSSAAGGGLTATRERTAEPAGTTSAPTAVSDALAKLEDLRRQVQKQLDKTAETDLRATFNDLLDAISDSETRLNEAEIADHTISLEAAASELDGGIEALERLRSQLAAIAAKIAAVARMVDTIDGVISGLKGVLATFA